MERRRVSRLAGMEPIGVDAVGNAADTAGDPEILRLENLDCDIRPSEAVLAATRAAVGEDAANSYLPFEGAAILREAATAHVSALSGVDYDWRRQCLVTAGGLNGILNVLLATVEQGDGVVVNAPVYVGLLNRIRVAGATPQLAPLRATAGGWRLDRDALAAAVDGRSRALLMMSPSMPTGCVLGRADWEAVAALCAEHDLWLVYDAAMERILFDGLEPIHPASIPGLAERTITVGAASKELRLIGWRVGWVVAPESLVGDVALVTISNVVTPVGIAQTAAAIGLRDGADVAAATAELERRRDALLAQLEGLPVVRPQGGWSLLLDAGALGLDGAEASARLFRERVAATPMGGWGGPDAGRYVRFVFANEPVERLAVAGERVRAALA